jgi:hypothetical protein
MKGIELYFFAVGSADFKISVPVISKICLKSMKSAVSFVFYRIIRK